MSHVLKQAQRERELEKIRGKRRRSAPSRPAGAVSARARYVLEHFRLLELPDGTWRAEWLRPDGSRFAHYDRPTRAAAIAEARRQWGHMNHTDEAEAFATIFPTREATR